jgi:hypothetical protein
VAESLQLHGRALLHDFLCYPINALWALPYLFLKKGADTLERLGVSGPQRFFALVPEGRRTRYQREIESRIGSELLEWPRGLFDELRADARLAPLVTSGALSPEGMFPAAPVRGLLARHSAGRAAITDISGTAGTMLIGWLMFHDQSLSVAGLGSRLARERAQDRAASHFFLGKGLGKAWYTLAPPNPTRTDLVIGIGLVTLLVVCICLVVSLVADPLRKALGLQQQTLHALIDRLEEQLHLQAGRAVRSMQSAAAAASASPPRHAAG